MLRGLALLTASFAGLWVAVPGFLASCVPDPAPGEESCPRVADCDICTMWISGEPALIAGERARIECEYDLDSTMSLDEARVEREPLSSSRLIEVRDVDVSTGSSTVTMEFTVPADGEDWQKLEVTLEFDGCTQSVRERLGSFVLLAERP